VVLLALIAGTISYLHMHLLVELHGQPGWLAALTPRRLCSLTSRNSGAESFNCDVNAIRTYLESALQPDTDSDNG
jgi:hypothetical protein